MASFAEEYLDDLNSTLIPGLLKKPDIYQKIRDEQESMEIKFPNLLFGLIYDNKDFEELAERLFSKINIQDLMPRHIDGMYYKTEYGKRVITEQYKRIFEAKEIVLNEMFANLLMFAKNHMDVLKEISECEDLHIRSLFMSILINGFTSRVKTFYPDITKYLSYIKDGNEVLMSDKDVCRICAELCDKKNPQYLAVKDFIYDHYPKNSLAYEFTKGSQRRFEVFEQDADKMFITSKDQQICLFRNYSHFISNELIVDLVKFIRLFRINDYNLIDYMYRMGLADKLHELVEKYLSLSKKIENRYLGRGSTTSSFKIGDYCFKLSTEKWSYEDIICPNLYLIVKNLDEVFVRDKEGFVKAAVEVQPFLSRPHNDEVPSYVGDEWKKELDRLGYEFQDGLKRGKDSNVMLLDSYLDADTTNHEELPDWFKEYPMVLVDRDLVFKKGNYEKKRRYPYR